MNWTDVLCARLFERRSLFHQNHTSCPVVCSSLPNFALSIQLLHRLLRFTYVRIIILRVTDKNIPPQEILLAFWTNKQTDKHKSSCYRDDLLLHRLLRFICNRRQRLAGPVPYNKHHLGFANLHIKKFAHISFLFWLFNISNSSQSFH